MLQGRQPFAAERRDLGPLVAQYDELVNSGEKFSLGIIVFPPTGLVKLGEIGAEPFDQRQILIRDLG